MMKTLAAAAVAILLGMGLSCPATAQLNELARAGLDLTDKDWELLRAAASKLYLTEDQPVGAVETWSNAESGNRGKIELVRIGNFQQMPCRRLQIGRASSWERVGQYLEVWVVAGHLN